MLYKDNPFYILDVSLEDNRRKIISQVEEKSFDIDEKICNDAQNILLKPQKRINAELCWFLNVDKSIVSKCISSIKNNDPIETDFGEDISFLISNLYNLSIIENKIAKKELMSDIICYVNILNELFDDIDIYDLQNTINSYRKQAKFPEATEEEIQSGLEYVRNFAKSIIQDKIKLISSNKENLVFFANKLINKKVIKGIVFEDIIDEYELQVSAEIKDIEVKIRGTISTKANKYNIKGLAGLLSKWQDFVKPIYIKHKYNGSLDYRYSNFLGDVRSYIIDIYNKDNEVLLSFVLLKYFKERINLCEEINKLINNDYKVIEGMINEISAMSYCNTLYDYVIGKSNDSAIVATVQEMVEAKRDLSNISRTAQTQHSESNNYGCWWIIVILVVILIICGIANSCNSGEDSATSSDSNNVVSSESNQAIDNDNETNVEIDNENNDEEYVDTSNLDSTGETVAIKNSAAEHANELKRNLSILKRELDAKLDEVDEAEENVNNAKKEFEDAEEELDNLKRQYDITGDEYYLNEYNNNVENCNELNRKYNRLVDEYNGLASEYRQKQNNYNSKVNEYNNYLNENSLN